MFSLNRPLAGAARFPRLSRETEGLTGGETAILLLCGMGAALGSAFIDLNLRVPGHAILKAVLPIAVGMSLVPRRGSGMSMGITALVTGLFLRAWGATGDGASLGALTGLFAIGPLLDGVGRTLSPRLGTWGAAAIAGLAANTLAFAVRGTAKYVGWEHAGGRPLHSWLTQAVVTYLLCGLIAGLAAAIVGFRFRPGKQDPEA